jgi:hypothetical protein
MGTAIVPVARGRALTRTSAANLPPAIANGILDVLTAFAAGPQQADADKKRLVRIYEEAVVGLEAAVAEHAIGWLKLHNPRNPFRPTPQDVYETCEKLAKEWRQRVLHHFVGRGSTSAPWGLCQGRTYGLEFPWGAEPFAPGCPIPDAVAKSFLRDYLGHGQDVVKDLAELGRERLAKIPSDCFMDGQLATALAIIEKAEHRQVEISKHDAYLDTLAPDLRWHRRIVLNTGDNHKLSEDDLIAAARQSLQSELAEEARRKIEIEECNRRKVVSAKPEVQAIISNMRAASKRGDEAQHKALVADFVAVLRKHGAKPPPHLEELNPRELDP